MMSPLHGQEDNDSLYIKGQEYLQQYQFQKALDYFFECQRNDPFNIEYLSKVGFCYYQLGNLNEAATYFEEVLKQDSFHISTLNFLSTISEQLLDYARALDHVESLISIDTTNGYYYRQAGKLNHLLGNKEAALFNYHHSIQLNPSDEIALIAFTDLLSGSGYLQQADSLLEAAIRKSRKPSFQLLYKSAKINYRLRTYDEVVLRIEDALEMGDTNMTYLPLLPFSHSQLERCDEAIPWLEYYVDRKEPNEQVHYFLGFCYHKMDSLEKSVDHYEKAIEAGISPNVGVYYQHLGDIQANQNKHRQALKYYDLALSYGNEDPVIFFHMAVAFDHLQKKDKKRPLELYKKYLAKAKSKDEEFHTYAKKRVEEIEYYEKHIWKGH